MNTLIPPTNKKTESYFVYLLECADGTLYAGSTTDVERRLIEHNSSTKGAGYTRSRRPVKLLYTEDCGNQSEAQKREYAIKQLTRPQKLALVEDTLSSLPLSPVAI
jgi:putative endonuclease